MLVAALSLSEIDLSSMEGYISGIKRLLAAQKPAVAVLPAHSALALGLGTGKLKSGHNFKDTFNYYIVEGAGWNSQFLDLHGRLAEELQVHLAAGTLIEEVDGRYYHAAYCFDPAGQISCVQRQTHLTRFARELQISRGDCINLFQVGEFCTALMIGNDARHPEVGRILGLKGADLLLYCGAIEGFQTCWQQSSAMWAQVQQNQFFAVEAQLSNKIADSEFRAALAIIAPCEITAGSTGYLARGNPGSTLIYAELDKEALTKIRKDYPLLKMLNPDAYTSLYGGKTL